MTPKEKIVYLAAIPLLAAAIGGISTLIVSQNESQPIVITKEAIAVAKDGKITIELVRRDETDSNWLEAMGILAAAGVFSFYIWALSRN